MLGTNEICDHIRISQAFFGTESNEELRKQCEQFFTAYFSAYWIPKRHGWTTGGRQEAADLLQVEPSNIPLTTNHLEGFNSALKKKYIEV